MLKKEGITDLELIDQIIADMEKISLLEIAATGPKLKVNIRFIAGPMQGTIISIDPTKTTTVFGGLNKKPKEEELEAMTGIPGEEVDYVYLPGARIMNKHFQLFYDSLCCSLLMKNEEIDCAESCGVYRRMKIEEEFKLQPDDAFRIGTLEFAVQRFNAGCLSDIGQRNGNEDSYMIV